jgi:hypothetical protein
VARWTARGAAVPEKRLKYADFVDIYANLTDAERERYQREYPEETRAMVSFQTRFEQQAKSEMLLLLLEQKFGPIDKETRQRVEEAGPDMLLRWSGRVLTEDSLEDVLQ